MNSPFWQLPIRAFESGIKRRKTFRYWRELDRTQWLQREELEAIQLRALRRLVAHAAERCAYYRDTWRSLGLDPAALTALDIFRRWPVIDQQTIRENRLAMRAQVPGMRLISKATGGSTGIPLELDLNPDSYDRRFAASFRGYSWVSAEPGRKQRYSYGFGLTIEGNISWDNGYPGAEGTTGNMTATPTSKKVHHKTARAPMGLSTALIPLGASESTGIHRPAPMGVAYCLCGSLPWHWR